MTVPLTVLTTVFNGEAFLEEAVRSILSQSLEEFEYLIIDDCSTDGTEELLTELSRQDSRVNVHRNDVNVGQTVSLARGLSLATGENVARLDADDVAMPDRLRIQSQFLQEHQEITVIGSACDLIDEAGQLTGDRRPAFGEAELLGQLLFYNPVIHSSVMFRRQPVSAIGGYDENFNRAQDYDLWLRCWNSNLRIQMHPDVLVHQRMHAKRVSNTQTGVMEECRKTAIRNGWNSLVGIEIPDWIMAETDHLLWSDSGERPSSLTATCCELKRLRWHIRRRFRSQPEVVTSFEQSLKQINSNLSKQFDVDPILYEKYIFGLPLPRVALKAAGISTALRKSSNAVKSFQKSWLYNCRPMRWLRSLNTSNNIRQNVQE